MQAVQRLGMTLCGIADRSTSALESAREASRLDPGACFTDAHAMLRERKPSAVVVATTAPSHAELVQAAADTGVGYILCEKPMATSLAEADTMIEACRRSGSRLAVNHQMRFMPKCTSVKALLGSDELGALSSVIVVGSNFGLAMNASHFFEAFRYLTDSPVRTVQAWLDDEILPNPRGPEYEDRSGRLLARGETGATLFIDFSSRAGHGLQVAYICRNGQVVVDELAGAMRVTARMPEFRDLPTTRYCMPADVRELAIEPTDAVGPTMSVWTALLSGQAFPDGAAGLHAMSCLVAAHASHESGGTETRLSDMSALRDRVFRWA